MRTSVGPFAREYLRSLRACTTLAVGIVVVWLVVLPAAQALLGGLDALLSAGTPDDSNWQIPIDLPNAAGGCADGDARTYTAPLNGAQIYQTTKGC